MFVRNGEALGSVHRDTAPDAPAPKRKPGRPKKEEPEETVKAPEIEFAGQVAAVGVQGLLETFNVGDSAEVVITKKDKGV